MSTAILFYFHIVLTGIALAAATIHLGAMLGAPIPRYYPAFDENHSMAGGMALWLLSGPVVLLRLATATIQHKGPPFWLAFAALAGSLIWAFCLGVLLLELAHRLFLA